MAQKSNLAEAQARLFPKQAHQPVGISPTSWITLSVGDEQNPGLSRRNVSGIECLQDLVREAINEQRVAGIDVVVVNRDRLMNSTNFAQGLPQ